MLSSVVRTDPETIADPTNRRRAVTGDDSTGRAAVLSADIVPGLQWAFGAEPHTGKVYYVLPDGEAWFANSTIDLWLRTLHHYGLHVSQSPILNDPEEYEDQALAELHELADELKGIDPAAFEGCLGFIWAEFLERWLW